MSTSEEKDNSDLFSSIHVKKVLKTEDISKVSKKQCKKVNCKVMGDNLICYTKTSKQEEIFQKIPLKKASMITNKDDYFIMTGGDGEQYLFFTKTIQEATNYFQIMSKIVEEKELEAKRQWKILNSPANLNKNSFNTLLSPRTINLSSPRASESDLKKTRNIYESTGALALRFSKNEDPIDYKERGLGNYNKLFQEAYDRLMEMNENTSISGKIDINLQLIHLAEDFINSARRYGRIIISEVFLPINEKTIKPAKLGGIIGGEKYIVQNILFKFAIDKENVFGGDHSAAMKVAGHELKGLKSYFQAGIKGLSFPLMATIETKGFKVIASSLLPLEGRSIIYGSNDAGLSIHKDDQLLNEKLELAAKQMNVKPHLCGPKEKPVMMFSCVDLEGHLGSDGRYYILDFSRIMPPVRPNNSPGGHLYRLFRPEFVKNYRIALCSDGYSKFTVHQSDHEIHKYELNDATSDLLQATIPRFSRILVKLLNEEKNLRKSISSFRLTEHLHSAGINVRYLGHVLKHFPAEASSEYKTFLIVEMVARVVKNMIRDSLRNIMKRIEVPIDEPYRKEVIKILNKIFGKASEWQTFWENITKFVLEKFEISNLKIANFPSDLRSHIFQVNKEEAGIDFPFLLFTRIRIMMGFRFTETLIEFLSKHNAIYDYARVFDETDLEDLGERVKHLDIISNAKGFVFTTRANEKEKMGYFVAAKYLYKQGLSSYEEALNSSPTDTTILKNCAIVLVKIEKLSIADKQKIKRIADIKISIKSPRIARADYYFRRAIEVDNSDASYTAYATFLEDCSAYKEAENNYLAALEKNPFNIYCLQRYGQFLQHIKNDELGAQSFFERSQQVAKMNAKESN